MSLLIGATAWARLQTQTTRSNLPSRPMKPSRPISSPITSSMSPALIMASSLRPICDSVSPSNSGIYSLTVTSNAAISSIIVGFPGFSNAFATLSFPLLQPRRICRHGILLEGAGRQIYDQFHQPGFDQRDLFPHRNASRAGAFRPPSTAYRAAHQADRRQRRSFPEPMCSPSPAIHRL